MPGEADPHLRAVVASVCDLGFIIEPLKVCKGRIVDGRLRRLGAKAAGLVDVPTVEIEDGDVASVILHSLVSRRHLTKSALAYLTFPVMEDALAESRRRRLANLRNLQGGATASNPPSAQTGNNTAEKIAESIGMSRRYLFYSRSIIAAFRKEPMLREMFEPKILSGELNLEDVTKGIAGWRSTFGKPKVVQQELDLWRGKIKGFSDPRKFSNWSSTTPETRTFIANEIAKAIAERWPDDVREAVRKVLDLRSVR